MAKSSYPKVAKGGCTFETYTSQLIKVLGSISVNVAHNGQEKPLSLLVVAGNGPSLLGRDWLQQITLDWHQINRVHSAKASCQNVLDRHSSVFQDELGGVKGVTAKFHIKVSVQPKFYKAHTVPYML